MVRKGDVTKRLKFDKMYSKRGVTDERDLQDEAVDEYLPDRGFIPLRDVF